MLELKDKVDSAKIAWENSKKTLGENAEETQKLKGEYEKLKKNMNSKSRRLEIVRSQLKVIQYNSIMQKLNLMKWKAN
ncbi:hypothetical protein [Caloramator sp. Dgby_cultured_2]|uniref:hypothetical protein n=1 Tax=Caloramator sp. Dgby_cultured_2 TaxID=3029174 RepID=UPI00237D73B5|nr:hypothetical protein [Caloramator sp. Dgby_cultured_2]WDU84204.1 hypothetical protein PWK10_07755 [Caloramator sp. Dgby_cultured_2]